MINLKIENNEYFGVYLKIHPINCRKNSSTKPTPPPGIYTVRKVFRV